MATVKDVYGFIDLIAPFQIQLDFDNAGFLVGRGEREVATILVALDITQEVVHEAVAVGAQLIVAHHPVIFHPVKTVTDEDMTGRTLLLLVENRVAAICAHTNLDAAQGGVNDCLARAVGLRNIEQLHQDGVDEQGNPYGIGRVGVLDAPCCVEQFALHVKQMLQTPCVRFSSGGRAVQKVAVGGGSCGSMLSDAVAKGCDTFLTADVKHDVFLTARSLGINLLDAGHFSTEDVVCQPLVDQLRMRFPELRIIKSTAQKEVFSAV